MRLRASLRLPKEHGAWGMLYVPMVLGAVTGGGAHWRVLLLALSATFLFIARESVLVWWRARSRGRDAGDAGRTMVIYLGLAAVFGGPLIVLERLFGLAGLALAGLALLGWNARQAARREERSMLTEVTGIIGLTLTAPATHYVAVGAWRPEAFWMWGLSALYFISSVFYVKLRVMTVHARREQDRRRIRRQCTAYHAALAGLLAALAAAGTLHPLALLAFAAVILRAFWHVARPAAELRLRRIGVLEIIYSLLFLVFAALAFGL